MILLCILLAVLGPALMLYDYALLKPGPCEKCEATISPEGTAAPLICPQCRLRQLPRKQVKIKGARGILVIFAELSIVGTLVGLMLGGSIAPSAFRSS